MSTSSADLQSLLNDASRYLQNGKNADAEACLQQVLELDKDHFDALHILGVLAHRAGNPDRAVELISRALIVNPGFPEAHFNLGKVLADTGRTREGISSYKSALSLNPEWDIALFNLGLLHAQNKDFEQAAQAFEKAIQINPKDANYFFNLGNVYLEMDEGELATRAYEESLTLDSGKFQAHNNLGNLYKKSGNFKRAAASYEAALKINPKYANASYNLGNLSEQEGDPERALEFYRQAVELDPTMAQAFNNMGNVYHQLKQYDRALEAYRSAVGQDPTMGSSQHMIHSLTGTQPSTAPSAYVTSLFDKAAPDFENRLVGDLKYRIFRELKEGIQQQVADGFRFARGVDLGCGTGLAGKEFRPMTKFLEGVDLSNNMVQLARQKNIYDTCHCEDLIQFLERSPERFDLFIAADVLVYIGDLAPLFAAVKNRAATGAYWAFSVEGSEDENYLLRPTGRFAHSRGYLTALAETNGFSIEHFAKTVIRVENDQPIPGYNFILQPN